jgi:hypothetical protein
MEEQQQKKSINMGIDDGEEFFAHETSINFNPTQFILDFRCITPRIDPRSSQVPFVHLKHNLVMVDPWHAKEILRVLTNSLENYEKQFGKIEQPKAVKKFLDKQKKAVKETTEKTQTPSYLG